MYELGQLDSKTIALIKDLYRQIYIDKTVSCGDGSTPFFRAPEYRIRCRSGEPLFTTRPASGTPTSPGTGGRPPVQPGPTKPPAGSTPPRIPNGGFGFGRSPSKTIFSVTDEDNGSDSGPGELGGQDIFSKIAASIGISKTTLLIIFAGGIFILITKK